MNIMTILAISPAPSKVINITIEEIMLTLTFILSIINFYYLYKQNKKVAMNTTITSNRMEWIMSVRMLSAEFVSEYCTLHRTHHLEIIRHKLRLYFKVCNPDQKKYLDLLDIYCNDYSRDLEPLLLLTEKVLDNSWKRMQFEAGLTDSDTAAFRNKIYKNEDGPESN